MNGRISALIGLSFVVACAAGTETTLEDDPNPTGTSSPGSTGTGPSTSSGMGGATTSSGSLNASSSGAGAMGQGGSGGMGCPEGSELVGGMCVDIDECAEGTDDCDALVTCTNDEPGFTCGACPTGYDDVNGDGTQCDDVDECAAMTDDCDPLVSCTNAVPGFTCGTCPMGYDDVNGDGTQCDDVDECTTGMNNCDPLAGCVNQVPGFICGPCPAGTTDVNGDGTNCQSTGGPATIGLDNTHGFDADSRLGTGADHVQFRSAITGSGASITVLNNLNPASLAGLDAVFVQQPYTSALLTSAQVTGLVNFVNGGGGLVVIGDGGGGFNSANLNLLAQNWNVTYSSSATWGSGQVFSSLASHPVTSGVGSFGVDFAPPMTTVNAPAVSLASVGAGAALAAVTGAGSSGNVVFVSDAFFTSSSGADYNIFDLGNATLLDNIIAFVTP